MSVSTSVAFGLIATFGYGVADFFAAIASRRVGGMVTYFWMQVAGTALLTVYLVAVLLNGSLQMPQISGGDLVMLLAFTCAQVVAYLCFYKGLAVGNVSVISPIVASFAAITVLLSLAFLDESLSGWRAAGVVLTLAGTTVTSIDMKELKRDGKDKLAAGVPYAVVAMVIIGTSYVLLAVVSRRLGWFLPVYFSRGLAVVLLLLGSSVARLSLLPSFGLKLAVMFCSVGALDTAGFLGYSMGVNLGVSSLVATAAATFPVVTVIMARIFLGERIALNRVAGISLIVTGLVLVAA